MHSMNFRVTPESIKGTYFGDPGGISYNTSKEQDLGSDRIELKRPSIESESGIANQGLISVFYNFYIYFMFDSESETNESMVDLVDVGNPPVSNGILSDVNDI